LEYNAQYENHSNEHIGCFFIESFEESNCRVELRRFANFITKSAGGILDARIAINNPIFVYCISTRIHACVKRMSFDFSSLTHIKYYFSTLNLITHSDIWRLWLESEGYNGKRLVLAIYSQEVEE
jgi:hypothetical protein